MYLLCCFLGLVVGASFVYFYQKKSKIDGTLFVDDETGSVYAEFNSQTSFNKKQVLLKIKRFE